MNRRIFSSRPPKRNRLTPSIFITLIFIAIFAVMLYRHDLPLWLGGLYLLMSLLTFISYARDKRAAERGQWRTSEIMLQLQALLCGWPGALLARQWLRHKSSKVSFSLVLWLMVLLNLAGLIAIVVQYFPIPLN